MGSVDHCFHLLGLEEITPCPLASAQQNGFGGPANGDGRLEAEPVKAV